MADDKRSREKQATDRDRRQQRRALEEALARHDEAEPPAETYELGSLRDVLESHEYPATAAELSAAYGHHEIELPNSSVPFESVLATVDEETYETPQAVLTRIERSLRR